MIRQRPDLHFLFLTKRIGRFPDCIPGDWGKGYENVTVGCTVENQARADERLSIFRSLPIRHKNIICQPMIGPIDLKPELERVERVVVGGEADRDARPLDYDWVLDVRGQCAARRYPSSSASSGLTLSRAAGLTPCGTGTCAPKPERRVSSWTFPADGKEWRVFQETGPE